MALGNNYDNNKKENNKNEYNFSMDSGYKFYNAESKIDQTAIRFSFWNNMLKITIAPKTNTTGNSGNEEFNTYDWDKGASAFISIMKARILYHELETFLTDNKFTNVGIPLGAAGDKILYVCNGKEFGGTNPCLVMIGVNEQGDIQSTSVYEFKSNFNFAIRNYDSSNKSFDKVYYNTIEIESLICILKEYCNAMVGAHAYSVISNNQRNYNRTKHSIEAIANKVGADLGYSTNSNNNRRSGTSFFNNSNNGNTTKDEPKFTNATLDELDNLI